MRILVYDVAADSGGAVTVLKSFYEEFCRDTENEYVFVLSVFELPDTEHIRVLNYSWVKKSPFHRLYFDHVRAHRLVKEYQIDQVLSLQNIEDPGAFDETIHSPCGKSIGADRLDETGDRPAVSDFGR